MVTKQSRKKSAKPRITAERRRDWKALPTSDWNTLTFTEYFRSMNEEYFGIAEYMPMRNWRFEQGVIKRALDAHGPELLRAAFDECFRTYRPSSEYPMLTAGFAVAYRINTILPRLIAKQATEAVSETDYEAVKAWL